MRWTPSLPPPLPAGGYQWKFYEQFSVRKDADLRKKQNKKMHPKFSLTRHASSPVSPPPPGFPRLGIADAEIKTHVLRTEFKGSPFTKPKVSQIIAMHASPTAGDSFLPNSYLSGSFILIFSKNLSRVFSGCGQCRFLCQPAD